MIHLLHLGTLDYPTALSLQQTLVELRHQQRIGDALLLLEHPPVITLGRNATSSNLLASPELLTQRGISLFETKRGGDITFHGPGQLVGYPIFDLRGFSPRLGAIEYVRRLEEVLIRTCGDLGILTERIPSLTGVWTQDASPKKIAAIGVHISRGITSHGFALNHTTDLRDFDLIIPCGIRDKDKSVTSIAHELGAISRPVPSFESLANSVSANFGRVFAQQILWCESLDVLLKSTPALLEDVTR
ncbi:MAG: lipoyl(octanoyl) transferase LipB [Acidobacteriaceae bacterium]